MFILARAFHASVAGAKPFRAITIVMGLCAEARGDARPMTMVMALSALAPAVALLEQRLCILRNHAFLPLMPSVKGRLPRYVLTASSDNAEMQPRLFWAGSYTAYIPPPQA